MTNRIHSYLDGDLPREALTSEERAGADRLRSVLDAAAGHLRATSAPDLTARVMASIPAAAPERREERRESPVRAALAWLWSPRPVRIAFRPAYGLAFAAVAALAVALLGGDSAPPGPVQGAPAVAAAPRAGPPVYVQFRLEYRGATSVRVAGTFTGWKPSVELRETAPGEWTALVPLEPGVHDYAFVVDGERWVADPHAPQVDDDFGGTNSRISLPPLGST
jgi:AMP-activated protein kinase-like protein